MNRLFKSLRGFAERQTGSQQPAPFQNVPDEIADFEGRLEVLCAYAERASIYEDELFKYLDQINDQLSQLQKLMEKALDLGKDRDALEYLRLAARLRPQRDLLDREIRSFEVVSTDLLRRVTLLVENMDEARLYAQSGTLNPNATFYLDQTIKRVTRYFILLERVTQTRRHALPERLAEQMLFVLDDRQLDLELATYILTRRRSLNSGNN